MKIHRIVIVAAIALGALAIGCASGFGDSYEWKRPCGTEEQRKSDSEACLADAAGLYDPSSDTGANYAQGQFAQCMEARGYQRVLSTTTLACE